MNIHISASELAILTGHNTYRDKKELYVKYWKKYWKSDYEQTVAYLKTKGKKAKLPETSSETVQRIARENNVSKSEVSKIFQASKEKDTNKMNNAKDNVLKKVLDQIPENQRSEFTKSANSVAYTGFGTRNETNAVQVYENLTGIKVKTLTDYFHDDIFIIEDTPNKPDIWSIGGKVDGMFLKDGIESILEIKNRMKGLFNSLRDYEKVQCYAYMFMLNLKCVHLAECYKKACEDAEMNIIEIEWDDNFWFNEVVNKLSEFVDDFYDFLKKKDRKIKMLE
jgi:hypothetical protein